MNKKILTLTILISSLSYAKLPVNIYTKISTGYRMDKISKEDFNKIGLGEIVEKDYKSHVIQSSLGLEVTYPIKLKEIDIEVGGGAEALLPVNLKANKVYKTFADPVELEKMSENQKKLEENLEKAELEYDKINYDYTIANNMEVAYKKKMIYERRTLRTLTRNLREMEEHLKTYDTPEKIEQLKKDEKEAFEKASKYDDEKLKLEEEYNKLKEKKESGNITEAEKARMLELKTPAERWWQDDTGLIPDVNKKRVEQLRRRQELMKIVELVQDGQKGYEKAKKEKDDLTNSLYENSNKISEYGEKKRKIRPIKNEAREKKEAAENELKVEQEKNIKELIKLTNLEQSDKESIVNNLKAKDDIREIIENSSSLGYWDKYDLKDDLEAKTPEEFIEVIEKSSLSDDDKSVVKDKIKNLLKIEDINKIIDAGNLPEYKKKALKDKVKDKFSDSSIIEILTEVTKAEIENKPSLTENNRSANIVQKTLDSRKFGIEVNTYAILGVKKQVTNDLEVFARTRLGLIIGDNPLNKVADELVKQKATINGSEYVKPTSLSKLTYKPFINAGAGIKYKGFKTGINVGYGKSYVGINFGYEF